MGFETWFAFVAASMVLLTIPGPTVLTVISYSVSHGRVATIPLVAAVALGDATAVFLSVVGLGAVLYTVFTSKARHMMASTRVRGRVSVAAGVLLSSAGVWALLSRRPAA